MEARQNTRGKEWVAANEPIRVDFNQYVKMEIQKTPAPEQSQGRELNSRGTTLVEASKHIRMLPLYQLTPDETISPSKAMGSFREIPKECSFMKVHGKVLAANGTFSLFTACLHYYSPSLVM